MIVQFQQATPHCAQQLQPDIPAQASVQAEHAAAFVFPEPLELVMFVQIGQFMVTHVARFFVASLKQSPSELQSELHVAVEQSSMHCSMSTLKVKLSLVRAFRSAAHWAFAHS